MARTCKIHDRKGCGLSLHTTAPCMLYNVGVQFKEAREEADMKYLLAWGLGVPGVLIVAWFLISHL
jgi:hypothetical protein